MPNTVPKTFVVGFNGLLGRYFYRAYREIFPDSRGATYRLPGEQEIFFDLADPDFSDLPLEKGNYSAAVIAAGISGVDRCEQNIEQSHRVNVDGTLRLIEHLQAKNILPIIFNSTAVLSNLSEYARQKLCVEQTVRNSNKPFLMPRLGKVFGLAKNDETYVNHMARQMLDGKEIFAAADEMISPTWVEDVVRSVLTLQQNGFHGEINIASPESMSRYDLALAVADVLGCSRSQVVRISLQDLPDGNLRVADNRLDAAQLQNEFNFRFTPMTQCLEMLNEVWQTSGVLPPSPNRGWII